MCQEKFKEDNDRALSLNEKDFLEMFENLNIPMRDMREYKFEGTKDNHIDLVSLMSDDFWYSYFDKLFKEKVSELIDKLVPSDEKHEEIELKYTTRQINTIEKNMEKIKKDLGAMNYKSKVDFLFNPSFIRNKFNSVHTAHNNFLDSFIIIKELKRDTNFVKTEIEIPQKKYDSIRYKDFKDFSLCQDKIFEYSFTEKESIIEYLESSLHDDDKRVTYCPTLLNFILKEKNNIPLFKRMLSEDEIRRENHFLYPVTTDSDLLTRRNSLSQHLTASALKIADLLIIIQIRQDIKNNTAGIKQLASPPLQLTTSLSNR